MARRPMVRPPVGERIDDSVPRPIFLTQSETDAWDGDEALRARVEQRVLLAATASESGEAVVRSTHGWRIVLRARKVTPDEMARGAGAFDLVVIPGLTSRPQ